MKARLGVAALAACLCALAIGGPPGERAGSHPLSRDHAALYRDADLLWAAEEAIRAHDFEAARATLARHARAHDGARAEEDRAGLHALLACLERPSTSTRADARAFYDAHRASPLRRRLRTLCLAAPAGSPAS